MLANVLLALGVAFLVGGRGYHVLDYNPAGARTMDLATACMLLVTYACYLVYMVKTLADFIVASATDEDEHGPPWSVVCWPPPRAPHG